MDSTTDNDQAVPHFYRTTPGLPRAALASLSGTPSLPQANIPTGRVPDSAVNLRAAELRAGLEASGGVTGGRRSTAARPPLLPHPRFFPVVSHEGDAHPHAREGWLRLADGLVGLTPHALGVPLADVTMPRPEHAWASGPRVVPTAPAEPESPRSVEWGLTPDPASGGARDMTRRRPARELQQGSDGLVLHIGTAGKYTTLAAGEECRRVSGEEGLSQCCACMLALQANWPSPWWRRRLLHAA
jgi:hypothetical protein